LATEETKARPFTIPKFDKRLHDAKHNNWDVQFFLTLGTGFEENPMQCAILDVDRFSIYVEETGTGEKFWLSKSAITRCRIMEPSA